MTRGEGTNPQREPEVSYAVHSKGEILSALDMLRISPKNLVEQNDFIYRLHLQLDSLAALIRL